MALRGAQKMLSIVNSAWNRAPEGVTERFRGVRIVRLPKVVIVMPQLRHWSPEKRSDAVADIVAYPRPEHIPAFTRAARGVTRRGPSSRFPGAVGSARIWVSYRDNRIGLSYIQAHFRTSNTVHPLDRALATRYGGWRKHLLREVVAVAHRNGRIAEFPRSIVYFFNPGQRRKRSQLHHELAEIAFETNSSLSRRHNDYVLKKKRLVS